MMEWEQPMTPELEPGMSPKLLKRLAWGFSFQQARFRGSMRDQQLRAIFSIFESEILC